MCERRYAPSKESFPINLVRGRPPRQCVGHMESIAGRMLGNSRRKTRRYQEIKLERKRYAERPCNREHVPRFFRKFAPIEPHIRAGEIELESEGAPEFRHARREQVSEGNKLPVPLLRRFRHRHEGNPERFITELPAPSGKERVCAWARKSDSIQCDPLSRLRDNTLRAPLLRSNTVSLQRHIPCAR